MNYPLDKPLTAKVTLAPKEVEALIKGALKARGVVINGDIKCLCTTQQQGDSRDTYQVAVFQGYEIDVIINTGKP